MQEAGVCWEGGNSFVTKQYAGSVLQLHFPVGTQDK